MSGTSSKKLTVGLVWAAVWLIMVTGFASVRMAAAVQAPPAKPSAASDDETAKNEIFNGDEWRQARRAFDNWLSVQRIYDDRQVADVKHRLQKKIAKSNARELRNLLEDMQDKLAILLSPEAGEVRHWMGYFASPNVAFTADELKKFDIVNMTPAQLQQLMQTVDNRRASRRQAGTAFNSLRQQQVDRTREANRQANQTRLANRDRAGTATRQSNQNAMVPMPRRQPEPRARRPIMVDAFGNIGMPILP